MAFFNKTINVILLFVLSSCSGTTTINESTSRSSSSLSKELSLKIAKPIGLQEAKATQILKEDLEFISSFSNGAINKVREKQNNKTFAFSPLSYYLNLSSLYSLDSKQDLNSINKLGADSQEKLTNLVSDISKRIYDKNTSSINPTLIASANLVADYASAFDQQGIEKITNLLYASYINNIKTIDDDLDTFIKEISNGNINKYPFIKPSIGKTSFISNLYVDIPYPLVFDNRTTSQPFNNSGKYPFYKGNQYATEIVQVDDYIAFRMGHLRFVKPLSGSLSEFFKTHTFDECFTNNDSQEYKIVLTIPKLDINSSLELLDVAKETGFLEDDLVFKTNYVPSTIDSLIQDNFISFTYCGVKAYSSTIMAVIPQSAPIMNINLDSSFAFEILGRDDIVLYYGEVVSLDAQ